MKHISFKLASLAIAMMFSLAGIPPLMGFWGKFVVFRAAVNADLIVLAALGIAASVIGAFYYLKIVKVMYFDEPAEVGVDAGATGEVLGVVPTPVAPPWRQVAGAIEVVESPRPARGCDRSESIVLVVWLEVGHKQQKRAGRVEVLDRVDG